MDANGDGDYEQKRVFAYDGNQVVLDFQHSGAGNVVASDLRWRYLWGPAVDQILAEEEVDGGTADLVAWTLTDHLNTVRDIAKYDPGTDTTTVVNHLVYDAFGRVTSESNPAVDSLFLFTARPLDADTGLQNNLNRWYDAAVGRWLSEDPIGFDAGDPSLVRYTRNRPTEIMDPFGWVECPGVNWKWAGTARGGQVIVGYYYYKAKFTCQKSLVVGETTYSCRGHCFKKKRYKIPVAHGSMSVFAIGAGLDSTIYAYAHGYVSADSSEDLAGWDWSYIGFSVTGLIVGGSVSGGSGNTEASGGLDVGLGVSLSTYLTYTRVWSSGYQLFDEPLYAQEKLTIQQRDCQKQYRALRPTEIEPTPATFNYMCEF
ncbi:hypothetical protein JCM17478_00520 [Thermopirellula anaerolimosa]